MRNLVLAGGFLAAFGAAAVAMVPLASVIGSLSGAIPLTARAASGPVWNGRLEGAALAGRPFGDVRARLAFLPLVTGVSRVSLEANSARGVLMVGRLHGVEGVTLSGPLTAFIPKSPLGGTLRLDGASAVFAGGTCKRAGGRITAEVSVPGGTAGAAPLSGQISCRGEAAVAVLKGGPPEAAVEAELRVRADGRYKLISRVRASDAKLNIGLALAGYEEGPQGWSRTDEGRLIG